MTSEQRAALERLAKEKGLDPEEVLSRAEQLEAPAPQTGGTADAAPTSGRPIAERLLIGFLPFIKVKELRALWLGLPDSIPDDELTCAEWSIKHGAPPSAGAADAPE